MNPFAREGPNSSFIVEIQDYVGQGQIWQLPYGWQLASVPQISGFSMPLPQEIGARQHP